MSKAKQSKQSAPAPAAKGGFDPKAWAKNGVSEDEVQSAKQAFDLFDTDQGGTVDIKELKAAMTSLGFEAKSAATFQMISDMDADGSGAIDFGEWLTLMTKRVNDKDSRANIDKIFALYDDQRTGYIDVNTLKRVAAELSENVSDAELDELIKRADVNGDGIVDADQFYQIVTRPIRE